MPPLQSLLLASASPRRADVLRQLGIEFSVRATDVDEDVSGIGRPTRVPVVLAERKARAALGQARDPQGPGWQPDWGGKPGQDTGRDNDLFILAADTVIVLDDGIVGKPADAADAKAILEALSGREHRVVTGIAVARMGAADAKPLTDSCVTSVVFDAIPAEVIDAYVATGESLGKAGAYAIQGVAAAYVKAIHGSYTNVVGLPARETVQLLSKAGHGLPGHLTV